MKKNRDVIEPHYTVIDVYGNFIGIDGKYYLEFCPACKKANEAFFIGSGKCSKCGFKLTYEYELDRRN